MRLHTRHDDVEYWEEEELLKIYNFKDISSKQKITAGIYWKDYNYCKINGLPLYKIVRYIKESSKDITEFEDKIYKKIPKKYHHAIKYYYDEKDIFGEALQRKPWKPKKVKSASRLIILPKFKIEGIQSFYRRNNYFRTPKVFKRYKDSYTINRIQLHTGTLEDYIEDIKKWHHFITITETNNNYIVYSNDSNKAYYHFKSLKNKLKRLSKAIKDNEQYNFLSKEEQQAKKDKKTYLAELAEYGWDQFTFKKRRRYVYTE